VNHTVLIIWKDFIDQDTWSLCKNGLSAKAMHFHSKQRLPCRYGGTITNQIRRLGASCDWSRERFTLDQQLSRKCAFFPFAHYALCIWCCVYYCWSLLILKDVVFKVICFYLCLKLSFDGNMVAWTSVVLCKLHLVRIILSWWWLVSTSTLSCAILLNFTSEIKMWMVNQSTLIICSPYLKSPMWFMDTCRLFPVF
jgi:hypothetical protein